MITIDLLTVYWYILIGSLIFAILFFLFGDLLHGIVVDLLHPLLLFGALSVLAGTAIILTTYSSMSSMHIFIISFLLGIIAYLLIYNFLIIPISHAETSSAHSQMTYQGRIGEVVTTIPATGYGEVILEFVSGSTNETAKSFDQMEIRQGTRVVVIEVGKDCIYVSPLEE